MHSIKLKSYYEHNVSILWDCNVVGNENTHWRCKSCQSIPSILLTRVIWILHRVFSCLEFYQDLTQNVSSLPERGQNTYSQTTCVPQWQRFRTVCCKNIEFLPSRILDNKRQTAKHISSRAVMCSRKSCSQNTIQRSSVKKSSQPLMTNPQCTKVDHHQQKNLSTFHYLVWYYMERVVKDYAVKFE